MDPISNFLCALRNGSLAQKTYVSVPYSKVVWQIGHVLHVHGYIYGMGIQKHASFSRIVFALLPQEHQNGAIKLARVSSPKKRVYLPVHHIKTTMHSFHIRILSTQKGIMADRDAVKANLGGEIICICA